MQAVVCHSSVICSVKLLSGHTEQERFTVCYKCRQKSSTTLQLRVCLCLSLQDRNLSISRSNIYCFLITSACGAWIRLQSWFRIMSPLCDSVLRSRILSARFGVCTTMLCRRTRRYGGSTKHYVAYSFLTGAADWDHNGSTLYDSETSFGPLPSIILNPLKKLVSCIIREGENTPSI